MKSMSLYELCEEICTAIAERPTNYYQEAYVVDAKAVAMYKLGISETKATSREICGTAYCRAGWMVALTKKSGTLFSSLQIARQAGGMLFKAGIPARAIEDLFAGGACGSGNQWASPAYIEAGIAGMRDFMKEYETLLKKASVEVEE